MRRGATLTPGRWRHPVQAAAAGLLAGLVVGGIDGLRAASLAGESGDQRTLGLITIDATVGAVVGLFAGLLLLLRRPRPGRWRVTAPALLLLALAVPTAVLRARSAPATLEAELRETWRLERPLPRLTAGGRPVVLISLDTVRADALAAMPALSRRAGNALRYRAAHATSSWTLPSMASVHTGAYYPAHGAARMETQGGVDVRTGLDPKLPTLAEQLQDRGYINAAVVTNPFNGMRYGMHRGFDRFFDLSRASLRAYALRRSLLLRPVVPAGRDGAAEVSDAALALLDPLAGGRFFLWLHYLDAHAPYSADPAGFDPLGACELPTCFNGWSQVRTGALQLDEADRTTIRHLYTTDLAHLDAQIERVFAALEAHDLDDDTLVVLLADHGEEFWEHGGVEHGATFYEEVVHVPFFAWVPGRAGAEVTHGVDIAAVPEAVLAWVDHGSLGPLEPGAPDRLTAMGSLLFAGGGAACTDGRYKAIRMLGRSTTLYDLATDPGERVDIAASEPERRQQLEACLATARSGPGTPAGPAGDLPALRALGYVE